MSTASVVEQDGRFAVSANSELLLTPAGNPVESASEPLAEAIAEELLADEVADVTRPSLYAFFSAQRDFIEQDPERTIDALVELLGHDFLVHPDTRLGRRQVQIAAWTAQIALWQRIAGQDPPYAPSLGEPDIHRSAYGAFRAYLGRFTPSQLSVAIHAANVLKSATLGMLLAEPAIDERAALEAMAVTPRLMTADTQEELEQEQEQEEWWREAIRRLLRYAQLSAQEPPAG